MTGQVCAQPFTVTANISSGGPIVFKSAADLGNNGGTTNSFPAAFTGSGAANALFLVVVVGDNVGGSDDITSVTYNGISGSLLSKQTTDSGLGTNPNRMLYVYGVLSASGVSGLHDVVVSSTSNHYLIVGIAEYTGEAQAGLPDASAKHDFPYNTASGSVSITTVADNSWVVSVVEDTYGVHANSMAFSGVVSTVRAFDAAFGLWWIVDSNGPIHPPGSVTASWATGAGATPDSTDVFQIVISIAP